jgi:hypothetical protein
MPLAGDRLQHLISQKDVIGGAQYPEGWAIVDGALIIYDFDNPPHWFPQDRDENGNTPEFVAAQEP